jgi:hypothetical protein
MRETTATPADAAYDDVAEKHEFQDSHNDVRVISTQQLTQKVKPPPMGDVNRDSGTDSANGG